MAWYPPAIRKPVTRHRTARTRDRGICLHIAASPAASLFGYFDQPGKPTSHFYVRWSGIVEQYVDTDLRAPAQLEGNPTLISIETQGGTGDNLHQGWYADQVESLTRLVAWIHATHPGIPLAAMPNSRPESTGVGFHRLGVNPWRVPGGELWSDSYGKICPTPERERQIPGIITNARHIAAGEADGTMAWDDTQIERAVSGIEEIARILRTEAVRSDSVTNTQLPDLRATMRALVANSGVDNAQIEAILAEIRDDVDRTADAATGPDSN